MFKTPTAERPGRLPRTPADPGNFSVNVKPRRTPSIGPVSYTTNFVDRLPKTDLCQQREWVARVVIKERCHLRRLAERDHLSLIDLATPTQATGVTKATAPATHYRKPHKTDNTGQRLSMGHL